MDTNFLNNGMETLNNISKLAANVSAKKEQKADENMTNQPHSQTVEVKVGDTDGRKPVVLKEKTETHIHKVFPDNRELNEKECEIEKIRLANEHELQMRELDYRIRTEEEYRKERREREEYARRERERRQASERRFWRVVGIGAGCAAVAGLGYAAYTLYTDSRRSRNHGISLGKPEAVTLAAGEGTVE